MQTAGKDKQIYCMPESLLYSSLLSFRGQPPITWCNKTIALNQNIDDDDDSNRKSFLEGNMKPLPSTLYSVSFTARAEEHLLWSLSINSVTKFGDILKNFGKSFNLNEIFLRAYLLPTLPYFYAIGQLFIVRNGQILIE